ncbi:MAG: phage tail fiber domain-containing protein [Pseudomonadales bacterium]
MALSFVEYQGDGITKVFAVPFEYIYRDDVKVTLNGQPATFSWLSPNSISLSTAPTPAQLLKIERDTEKQTALVDFKNDSVLDEALLDLMWKQVFMIIQEAQDQTDVSYGISDNARAIAAEAKGIAQTAETKADSATATANGAVTTANTALSTANTATSTARPPSLCASPTKTWTDAFSPTAKLASPCSSCWIRASRMPTSTR